MSAAQINKDILKYLFLVNRKMHIAIANEFAACDEQNPYMPPAPFGKCIQD
jgi:hypothetical protein